MYKKRSSILCMEIETLRLSCNDEKAYACYLYDATGCIL